TAYDAIFGSLADEAGVDVVLVGDSVGNTVMGHPNMLKVTLDDIAHHVQAVANGVRRALLVADLPFGSYQESPAQAVRSAVQLVR
uniref:3-methyl-2-oxobutanoate hydroxymethyltransferase n=1 Tax=Acinetobacter sp. LH3_13 TaxID=3434463 RepID=UPI003EC0F98A